MGLGDVGDLHLRRVGLGPCAHRADQRQRTVQSTLYQRQFGREGVDGVHCVVVFRGVEQQVGLLVLDVTVDHREFYFRVDVAQAFGQNFGFPAADGRVEGDQLAVDVARRHVVGVGDGHAAHAGPDDHLGGIGAHAAQPDDQYVGLSEQVEFLFAEQQLGAFKPIIRIHFQVLCSFYRAGNGGVPAALSCPCGPAVNIRP